MRPHAVLCSFAACAVALCLWGCAPKGPVAIGSLEELANYAARDGVSVRLAPGTYTIDRATTNRFIRFTGRGSRYDLRGVTLRVDTHLFSRFGAPKGPDGFYCAIDLAGDGAVFEGAKIETFGDRPGLQSRNKIINVTGRGAMLRDVEITTSGSSPWGYGSLFGISGAPVRKMNGIRVGWPAEGARIIGCRVHMRAMGHGIFVQGATGTVIEDCHVDGLLRKTDEILAETSGFAFEKGFLSSGKEYVEGVKVGPDGRILPGEVISLSEDGIRLYDKFDGHPTGPTEVRRCTVRQMRRGICTGLGPAGDSVTDCEVSGCVAAGFNVGTGDVLERCKADAKYSEALSCPYVSSRGSRVDLEVLDSRGGSGNDLLATINGRGHTVRLHAREKAFVPPSMIIALGTRRGYAFYQDRVGPAADIHLTNDTQAAVVDESQNVGPR